MWPKRGDVYRSRVWADHSTVRVLKFEMYEGNSEMSKVFYYIRNQDRRKRHVLRLLMFDERFEEINPWR